MTSVTFGCVTEKHITTCPVDTLHFMLYCDDAVDILLNGQQELRIFQDHLDNLHPNLKWTIKSGPEGGYLDLWLMLENGRIEWRNFKKTPPVYVGPESCHDPAVKGAIVKGVGHRLRINSSKDEYFRESVEDTARAFKISGYNYQKSKKELMEFEDQDPIALIKKDKTVRNKPEKGVKSFYISKYDPRLPHPRKLISRNYHHLANHPVVCNLFPRENLVGGTKRLPNLSELLSPTVQQNLDDSDQPGPAGDGRDDGQNGGGGGMTYGSYHCDLYKTKGDILYTLHLF